MKNRIKIYIVVCEAKPLAYFDDVSNQELFFAPLYEHTFRKFKDAANKLGIEGEFFCTSTFNDGDTKGEINPDINDIVIFASPLAFLADSKAVEGALEYVCSSDLGYATIGSMIDLYATVGTGKMLSGGEVGTPSDFITHINKCGAKCVNKSFLDGEKASPETKLDYLKRVNIYREEFLDYLVMSGVDIELREGIIIAPNTEIRKGTKILPGTEIRRMVKIHENCIIGPDSIIENSEIGEGCVVNSTQVYDSLFEKNIKIGPFCHVRPNSHLLSGVKVGDFVEIKNSTIGNDTHASHLTYIGDSDVGARVNFGCGVVTVNYDGRSKNRCKICDDAFIGCNTNLVAPITIGKGAFTAAGSTITDDVPAGALAIAREYQSNHDGWATRRRKK